MTADVELVNTLEPYRYYVARDDNGSSSLRVYVGDHTVTAQAWTDAGWAEVFSTGRWDVVSEELEVVEIRAIADLAAGIAAGIAFPD